MATLNQLHAETPPSRRKTIDEGAQAPSDGFPSEFLPGAMVLVNTPEGQRYMIAGKNGALLDIEEFWDQGTLY